MNEETPQPLAANTPGPALDPAAIQNLRLMLGDEAADLLPSLVEMFVRDTAKLQAEAQHALAEQRAVDLQRAAHTLKSNSANFGLTSMTALCAELEHQAKNKIFENAADLLARIQAEYQRAQPALEKLRDGPLTF